VIIITKGIEKEEVMKRQVQWSLGIVFLVFTLLVFLFPFNSNANIPQPEIKEIRWIIAHSPVEYFLRAANRFKDIIEKESNGQIVVKILLREDEIANSPIGELIDYRDYAENAKKMLASNEVQMMQIYTSRLAVDHPDFYVLDIPGIFRDYDHIDAVIEGPIGRQLMASLDNTNLKPLAFTFSGGFMSFVSQGKPFNSLDDIDGFKARHYGVPNQVTSSTYQKMGVIPVRVIDPENGHVYSTFDHFRLNLSDIIESNYDDVKRYLKFNEKGTYVINTKHRVLFTSLIMNQEFYDSLTPKEQKLVEEAAFLAAREERRLFTQDEETLMNSEYMKTKIYNLSKAEQERMDEIASEVEKEVAELIGQDIISEVKTTQ